MLSMTETVKPRRTHRRESVAARVIRQAIVFNGGKANRAQIKQHLVAMGFASMDESLRKALDEGLIIRLRPGLFGLPPE